jgi:hypothetical protein
MQVKLKQKKSEKNPKEKTGLQRVDRSLRGKFVEMTVLAKRTGVILTDEAEEILGQFERSPNNTNNLCIGHNNGTDN